MTERKHPGYQHHEHGILPLNVRDGTLGIVMLGRYITPEALRKGDVLIEIRSTEKGSARYDVYVKDNPSSS